LVRISSEVSTGCAAKRRRTRIIAGAHLEVKSSEEQYLPSFLALSPAFLAYAVILQSVAISTHFVAVRIRCRSLRRSLRSGDSRKNWRGEIAMRRLLSMAAFGFGFYYLWNNTDPTVEFASLGAIGLAILLEFAAPD
jgi:hypothetical protein